MSQSRQTYHLPPITLLMVLVEIGAILACALIFTWHLQDFSPNMVMENWEYAGITNSASVSRVIFDMTGKIPLWNPFMRTGEPVLENLFSFNVNPLMFLPVLWFGPIQGFKVALLIHLALMGTGGWAFGRVLRLGWPGRVLLGLLMLGSGLWAATLGLGYYQIGLSQAYVPWVLAGLLGTLYLRSRLHIGVLAVSSALMVFAGTFWFVLPTAISAAVIVLVSVARWDKAARFWRVDSSMVRRFAWATFLTGAISMIRVLPLLNGGNFVHANEELGVTYDFKEMLSLFFTSNYVTEGDKFLRATRYSYVLPWACGLLLLAAWIVVMIRRKQPRYPQQVQQWQFLAASVFLSGFYIVWAQDGTPFFRWLYQMIPFLGNWRYIGRMGGAAIPFIAAIAAIFLDDCFRFLRDFAARKDVQRVMRRAAQGAMIALLAVAAVSAADVLSNWSRVASIRQADELNHGDIPGLLYLRSQHPNQLLPILTQFMPIHYGFFDTLTRQAVGNEMAFLAGLPATIGPNISPDDQPEFAVTISHDFAGYLPQLGYQPDPNGPQVDGQPIVWERPDAVNYAFLVSRATLESSTQALTRSQTTTISTYDDWIDRVHVRVDSYGPDDILVILETSYKGWYVTINGQQANIESIGGRLGVVLPPHTDSSQPLDVVFSYHPSLVYWGGAITILGALLTSLYLLKIDKRLELKPVIPEFIKQGSEIVAKKAAYVLLTPGLVDGSEEEEPTPRLLPAGVESAEPTTETEEQETPEIVTQVGDSGSEDHDAPLGD